MIQQVAGCNNTHKVIKKGEDAEDTVTPDSFKFNKFRVNDENAGALPLFRACLTTFAQGTCDKRKLENIHVFTSSFPRPPFLFPSSFFL